MSSHTPAPQPTDVLVKRLRRVAKACDEASLGRAQGTILLGSAESWRARANTCWQAAARLEELDAQRMELVAALKAVTEDMDMAGGDGYGMAECPWCHKADFAAEHHADCELVLARAVLTKAEGR